MVHRPLTAVASPVAEHRLWTRRLSSHGSRAQPLRGMWDLPGPGHEPASHASAGRLPATAPPSPYCFFLKHHSLQVKPGPLAVVSSPVAEHRLWTRRLSGHGSWAQLLCGMWDLPGPGHEPVSPALAGGLSTTAPPGKPFSFVFWPPCSMRDLSSLIRAQTYGSCSGSSES